MHADTGASVAVFTDGGFTPPEVGGAEIVNLLKTGSAYYAPSSAAVEMARSILNDEKRVLPCAAWCTGQYGVKDMFVGVPCVLGKNGIERIIELDLDEEERKALHRSAETLRRLNPRLSAGAA